MEQNGSSSSPLSSVAYPPGFTGPPRYLSLSPFLSHSPIPQLIHSLIITGSNRTILPRTLQTRTLPRNLASLQKQRSNPRRIHQPRPQRQPLYRWKSLLHHPSHIRDIASVGSASCVFDCESGESEERGWDEGGGG